MPGMPLSPSLSQSPSLSVPFSELLHRCSLRPPPPFDICRRNGKSAANLGFYQFVGEKEFDLTVDPDEERFGESHR